MCPNCDADLRISIPGKNTNRSGDASPPSGRKPSRKDLRRIRKAEKREQKQNMLQAMSLGQRVGRAMKFLLLWMLLIGVLGFVLMGLLAWTGAFHIPILDGILSFFGVQSQIHAESSLYAPQEDTVVYDRDTGEYFVNNIVILFFEEGVSQAEIEETVTSINGKIVGSIPAIDQYQVEVGEHSLQELKDICQQLKERPCVFEAIYDTAFPVQTNVIPNDPWTKTWFNAGETWSQANPSGANWWLEAVDAMDAWEHNDRFSTIRIGVVDNGVDTGHEDLKNVIVSTSSINNKADHGSHVSGIIGAEANNNKGITGLVWDCGLLTYDWQLDTVQSVISGIFNISWSTSTQIFGGTAELVENGAKVINLSAGQTGSMVGTTRSEEDIYSTGHYASLYLYSLLTRGYDFVIVQSAGNGNESGISVDARFNGLYCSINEGNCVTSDTVAYQDIIDRIIVVGAAQNDGGGQYSQPSWSNAGPRVDICAPGNGIYSTVTGGLSGRYTYLSGTSMAAPIVTGVAALVWAANRDLTGAEVKAIVCDSQNTRYDVADNSSSNHPLVNSYRMVNASLAVEAALNYVRNDTHTSGVFQDSDLPTGAVEFQGHYYYIYDERDIHSYQEASEFCRTRNGYLATITTREENDFLYNYMTGSGFDNAYFGMTDDAGEGAWQWSNQEAVSYLNWANGEPNGGTSENYAMFYYRYPDGTWNDGDFGYNTIDGNTVFICEWGEYEIVSLKESGRPLSGERDIVLTLDVSGSMSGTPLSETKKAATNFIETILREDASIGVVSYDNRAYMNSDFSGDRAALTNVVNALTDGGSTNIEDGLATAYQMLNNINAKKKIIVLMSDGEPNAGKEGDELVAYADMLKDNGITIYTLGFFESLGYEKGSAQLLMERIASEGCHYEVANADDLVFFFDDVADQINGQRYIYVRIACPVDVMVSYGGETLDSSEKHMNLRTDFGTLTFEDSDTGMSSDDDRIKVLRLKEGVDYDIKIRGTGTGTMDYTIAFMDAEGEYSDFRRFENVRITRRTVIDTVAAVSDTSTLNVDEDGDGRYDIKYRATENGRGREVHSSWKAYTAAAALLFAVIVIPITIVIIIKRKNRKEQYDGKVLW